MNSLLALIGLRSAALGLALAGQQKVAATLYLIADVVESGRASEEHLREVAQKLNEREIDDADWDDVVARIDEASARLQSVQPGRAFPDGSLPADSNSPPPAQGFTVSGRTKE